MIIELLWGVEPIQVDVFSKDTITADWIQLAASQTFPPFLSDLMFSAA